MEEMEKETLSDTEILKQILDIQKTQAKIAKKTQILVLILTAAIVIAAIVIVPSLFMLIGKATTTVNKANDAIDNVTGTVQRAESTLDGIDEMTSSASLAASNMNQLVEDNATTLNESITSLSEVDFEGLNEAISDLRSTVGPMADMMKALGR